MDANPHEKIEADDFKSPPSHLEDSYDPIQPKLSTPVPITLSQPIHNPATPPVNLKASIDPKFKNVSQHATEVIDESGEQAGPQDENGSKQNNVNGKRHASETVIADEPLENGLSRPASKGSQTEPTAEEDQRDTIVDEAPANGYVIEVKVPTTFPSKSSERNGVTTAVKSRQGSPARASIPVLAQSKNAPNTQAAEQNKDIAVFSPQKEMEKVGHSEIDTGLENAPVREEREEEALLNVSLQIPKVTADAASSPESTSGALSATTPAFHEASTDTSPDNEALQYDAHQHSRKSPEVHSPSIPTRHDEENQPQEIPAAKARSVEPTVDERPSSADAQLQLDAEQAAASAKLQAAQIPESSLLNNKIDAIAQGQEDEDELMGIPTQKDKTKPNELPTPVSALDKSREIPDSQETRSTDPVIEQSVTPSNMPTESRKSPEKQAKPTKEPSPVTTSSTPRRTPSVAPPIERMTTRVSSGAIRNRSVSEIIGEKENQTTSVPPDASTRKGSDSSKSTSRASTPQTPLMRSMVERAKEKERSKLSTVIFAKQPAKRLSDDFTSLPSGGKQQSPKSDDYLKPYFESQISERLKYPNLTILLQTAHKTLSTSDVSLPIEQTQMNRVINRIQHLQHESKWSLRQPKRSIEPNRPTTHRDLMMQEMKWMRTDFREERKWKMAAARNLARDCAVYVESSNNPGEQALLKVRLRRQTRTWDKKEMAIRRDCHPGTDFQVSENDVEMIDAHDHDQPTPDLIPSGEESSPPDDFDDEVMDIRDTAAPTAIFTLADDDVVFRLRTSPTSEKLLNELPVYGAPLKVPQSLLPTSEHSPDAHWKRPILPLSKFTEGQMVIVDEGPPRKKSRYQYETDDEDDVVVFDERQSRALLPPETTNVALFNPENKHIRDRIHASHQFRPPSEFPMPMQSFFENRECSQWTNEEDDELKRKVREYAYNWSFIASDLQRGTARSCTLFTTPAERRTPWECFERWVHLEGLPQDMAKTTYFRAYTSRVGAAERNLSLQQQASQQQSNGAAGALKRPKRSALAMRVDRRRNMKHLHLVDSMRKNAKKKEVAQAKQLQAATVQQQRKQNEQAQAQANANANAAPRPIPTPQDMSRMKHEKEMLQKEKIEAMQKAHAAARQAQLQQARQALQNPQLSAQQQQALLQQRAPNGANPPNSQNLAVPGQNRNSMQHTGLPMQLPNPNGLAPPMPMNGIPQAQMQNMQNMRAVMPPNVPSAGQLSAAQLMQARQVSDQQRMIAAQQQHAQSAGGANLNQNSPPNMRAGLVNMNMNQVGGNPSMRPNFMGALNNNGLSSPSTSVGLPPPGLQQGSPRMGRQTMTQGQTNQYYAALQHDLRVRHPTATDQQLQQMVSEVVARRHQNAMQAAAGGSGSPNSGFSAGSPTGSMSNPMSSSGANSNGNGDNHDGNGSSMGNVGMMRGSLGNASGMQPQTYANILRQQQMQQQMLAQQQGQGGGHMRNGSLSAQNQGGQNGQAQNQQGQGMGNGNGQHSNGGMK